MKLASLAFYAVLAMTAPAISQDNEAARREAADAAAREAARQQDEKINAAAQQERDRMIKQLHDAENAASSAELAAKAKERERLLQEQMRAENDRKLQSALRGLQTSQKELSEALGFKTNLKQPAQKLGKHAEVFLDFLKNRKVAGKAIDSNEFKSFGNTELGWETLATTERLIPQLAAIIANERHLVVDLQVQSGYPAVKTELLRLQWMTRQLK